MRARHRRFVSFIAPLLASVLLNSCVSPDDPQRGTHSSNSGGASVHTTLPKSYSGSAYFHDGRYYSGGRYQAGNYSDGGRSYSSRYEHNGRFYYGGNYQNHSNTGTRLERRQDPYRPEPRNPQQSYLHSIRQTEANLSRE